MNHSEEIFRIEMFEHDVKVLFLPFWSAYVNNTENVCVGIKHTYKTVQYYYQAIIHEDDDDV